ncbi:putative transcriptional regulatory protein C530.05-like protein 8 [Colletotrichum chlorophyti]|uniref:Putative transcriptional regulatory protein C530.05-like protein 8 n=1 Tax=Colletotrichum chlorophyti TaxID=708187 RepID=A0A1Q8RPL5_9PEZI|nr:putative transcriptional regulatory protein C530.05-like protein 8 [Colletotrichum chlorophyti]
MSSYVNLAPNPVSDGTPPKRRRINFACNYCRNRKTRCDEQKPSCRACRAAGVECVTTDLRRPGSEVQRCETKRRAPRASVPSLTCPVTANVSPKPIREMEICEIVNTHNRTPSLTEVHGNDVRKSASLTAVPRLAEPPAVIYEEGRVSSDHPNAKYQGRLPVIRPIRGSSSIEILVDWLDLAARRLGVQQQRGLPTEPEKLPLRPVRKVLSSEPRRFPSIGTCQVLSSRFLEGINLVYPLVNLDHFKRDLEEALESNPLDFADKKGLAALCVVYLVLAIGFASDPTVEEGLDALQYLTYCQGLLGHLVARNNADNVRAIVLLALCSYCYDDCVAAWNTLSVGVSMAMLLGLQKPRTYRHRHTVNRLDFIDEDERRCFWLGVYAFEKFLSFEMGRQSAIDDEGCYPPHVDMPTSNGASSKDKVFPVAIDLARVLSEIGRKAVAVSKKEDGLSEASLQSVIIEKIQTTGEAQLLLTRWAVGLFWFAHLAFVTKLTLHFTRPTSDILIGSRVCPFTLFISMLYHSALIILSRNSLLISEEALSAGANVIAKGKPWAYIVPNGQSIAANAARKTLRVVVEFFDSKTNAILPNLLAPLSALSTLAIHVVTHPDSRVSRMDLNLIHTSSESMREIYARLRGDCMLDLLLQKLDALLQRTVPDAGRLEKHLINSTSSATATAKEGTSMQNSETRIQGEGGDAAWTGEGDTRHRGRDTAQPTTHWFGNNHDITAENSSHFDPSEPAKDISGDDWLPSLSDETAWDWSCLSELTDQSPRAQ